MVKLIIVLGVVLALFIGGLVFIIKNPDSNPQHTETAMILTMGTTTSTNINASTWLWDAPDTFTRQDLLKMFRIAKSEGISTIYLRMDDYGDIYGMKDGVAKTARLEKFNAAAYQFITVAQTFGINVQALGGNTDWAEPEGLSFANRFFQGVLSYNSSNTHAQFSGVQFDVEANNSAAYKINKTKTLTNYLDFVQAMMNKKPKTKYFALGFTVPLLYARPTNQEVIVNWQNRGSKLMAYSILDILNQGQGGYIAFMDYRNVATGSGGAIDHAQNIMDYGVKNAPAAKIMIGQETTNVLPAKITFFDTSKAKFKAEAAKIVQAFGHYSNFGGIAVHDLPGYIDL